MKDDYYDRIADPAYAEEYRLKECINELKAQLNALRSAVAALPVEEWVEMDSYGSPELIGYVMQAQGEWDNVKKLLEPPE